MPTEWGLAGRVRQTFKEWRILRIMGQAGGSTLERMVSLKQHMVRLGKLSDDWRRPSFRSPENFFGDWQVCEDGDTVDIISYAESESVFEAVMGGPMVIDILGRLSRMVGEVCRSLLELVHMESIWKVTEDSFNDALQCGTNPAEMCNLFTLAITVTEHMCSKRALADEGQETNDMALLGVLKAVMQNNDSSIDPVTITECPGLFRIAPSNANVTVRHVLLMMELFCMVHAVSANIGFLRAHAFGRMGCLKDNRLKDEVTVAIKAMDDEASDLHNLLRNKEFETIDQGGLPWVLTVAEAKNWAKAVMRFSPWAKRMCVSMMLDDNYSMAESVSKDTPQFSHVVTETAYHPNLAKRNLLRPAQNDRLQAGCVALCNSMKATAAAHASWGLEPRFEEDSDFTERRAFCTSAYNGGKSALIVIAAVKVLEVGMGDDASTKKAAAGMLEKRKAHLPPPILAKLCEICGAMPKKETARKKAESSTT